VRERGGDDAFAWSDAGYKKLKGISDPLPVFRCRRGPAG
jgi:class 3 adenylate cyclase